MYNLSLEDLMFNGVEYQVCGGEEMLTLPLTGFGHIQEATHSYAFHMGLLMLYKFHVRAFYCFIISV